MKHRRKGRVSEEIAASVLERLGFEVLERRKRVIIDDVEVGEVDLIAKKGNELYAVEVKAGSVDVSSVRFAYANAKLLNMKPLIVAKGFSNEAAKVVAKKLGVEVIELSDMFLVDEEELYFIVKEAVKEAIIEVLSKIIVCKEVSEEDLSILKTISNSSSFLEAAERLGISVEDLARKVSKLKREGIIESGEGFNNLKFNAAITILCNKVKRLGMNNDKGCSL